MKVTKTLFPLLISGFVSWLVVIFSTEHVQYTGIVEDLDHPFYGVWNVDKTPIEQLLARFEEELGTTSRMV